MHRIVDIILIGEIDPKIGPCTSLSDASQRTTLLNVVANDIEVVVFEGVKQTSRTDLPLNQHTLVKQTS